MDDDVPSGIDLRDPTTAEQWAREADAKRPFRAQIRERFATLLRDANARRVLELGSGPGLLAETVLASYAPDSYVLFDFSPPMLEMARARVGTNPAARFVLGDFKADGWARELGTFDAIITMQAVHELRHKRHAAKLYAEARAILAPGGMLLVCDHEPLDDARQRALHATEAEQQAALRAAGFTTVETKWADRGMYLIAAQ